MTAPATLGTGAEPERPADSAPDAALRRRTSPFTVFAMTVAILVIAGGIFAVASHGFRPKTRVAYQLPAVFKLRAGECFNSGPDDTGLTVRPCSTPHDSEVFATFQLPRGSAWPGDAALRAEAGSGCSARMAAYVNPDLASSALDQEFIYPGSVAWRAGFRTVVCDVRFATGPITGSVRQSP